MLRIVPGVGRIFLTIKGEDKDEVNRRLKNEVIDEELFRCLKEIHGISYEAFMTSKLFPVLGNICKDNLGMDGYTAREIANQVHVIINTAANTTFDERYDVALNTNTKGPSRLLDFANKCKNLKLFLHVSTAYVNGERDGIVLEKPFHLGRSIAEERMNSTTSSSQVSLPLLDVSAVMKLAFEMMKSLEYDNQRDQKMKDLGTQRAKMCGFYDTYSFTKAMVEMLVNSKRESLTVPIVIVRPSIIESTYREPFPGWIQGNKVIDPLFISYGKGQLSGFVGNPNTILDIVPVDMVVNVILTAIAKHGSSVKTQAAELIYHITSSVSNPISFGDVFNFAWNHFTCFQLVNSDGIKIGVKKFKYFTSIHTLSSWLKDQPQTKYCIKRVNRFLHIAKIYEPYVLCKARFDNSNTKKLLEDMSGEERTCLGLMWRAYSGSITSKAFTFQVSANMFSNKSF